MSEAINHDRLFKQLISTFFVEFIELFFPQVMTYLDTKSVTLLDKEIFTDLTEGDRHESDLIAQVKWKGENSFFLVHIEAQSSSDNKFNRRMFVYFSRLYEKYALRVYPIVIFSYDSPLKEAINQHQVNFPDFKVLEFNYRTVQLNRLNWRDYLNQVNPVASALMSKMKIELKDRPKVKAECLRLLATLKLNPAKTKLVSGFIDTYLKLNQTETILFKQEVSKFSTSEKESVMQITTSWMLEGIEIRVNKEKELIIRLIKRKFGEISSELEAQIRAINIDDVETLMESLFDFNKVDDLTNWLHSHQ